MSPDAVNTSDHWMLRARGGPEYGPVPFDVLRAWAAQNRFTAGYEISHNRRDWRPVEIVPELGMDWFVEPGAGSRYGPFHPLALLDYIREGAVPPETRVVHKLNGGKAKAYQVLLEAFVDAIDQTGEVQGELIRQVHALQERLEERDRWFAEESRQLQEEREKRKELEIAGRRLEEQDGLTAGLQARLANLEAELARAGKEREAERDNHRETVLRLDGELRSARAGVEQRIRDMAEKARAQSQAEIDALKAGESALRQELKQIREAAPRQRQEVEERLKKAEIQLAEASAAASRAEAELAVIKGRYERERQARESDRAELDARAASEARKEGERMQLLLATATLKVRLAELEKEREQAVLENEAAQRDLEVERGRILLLEARLAERAEARPLREDPNGSRRRPAWASGPMEEVPARKPGSLAGLEAQAQAELKAWQEKKQAPPKTDPAPKNKSWIPWKQS